MDNQKKKIKDQKKKFKQVKISPAKAKKVKGGVIGATDIDFA